MAGFLFNTEFSPAFFKVCLGGIDKDPSLGINVGTDSGTGSLHGVVSGPNGYMIRWGREHQSARMNCGMNGVREEIPNSCNLQLEQMGNSNNICGMNGVREEIPNSCNLRIEQVGNSNKMGGGEGVFDVKPTCKKKERPKGSKKKKQGAEHGSARMNCGINGIREEIPNSCNLEMEQVCSLNSIGGGKRGFEIKPTCKKRGRPKGSKNKNKKHEECSMPENRTPIYLSLTNSLPCSSEEILVNVRPQNSPVAQSPQEMQQRLKDIMLSAGWKILLRSQNGHGYGDYVYISPSGSAYGSLPKAWDAFVKESSMRKEREWVLSQFGCRAGPRNDPAPSVQMFHSLQDEGLSKYHKFAAPRQLHQDGLNKNPVVSAPPQISHSMNKEGLNTGYRLLVPPESPKVGINKCYGLSAPAQFWREGPNKEYTFSTPGQFPKMGLNKYQNFSTPDQFAMEGLNSSSAPAELRKEGLPKDCEFSPLPKEGFNKDFIFSTPARSVPERFNFPAPAQMRPNESSLASDPMQTFHSVHKEGFNKNLIFSSPAEMPLFVRKEGLNKDPISSTLVPGKKTEPSTGNIDKGAKKWKRGPRKRSSTMGGPIESVMRTAEFPALEHKLDNGTGREFLLKLDEVGPSKSEKMAPCMMGEKERCQTSLKRKNAEKISSPPSLTRRKPSANRNSNGKNKKKRNGGCGLHVRRQEKLQSRTKTILSWLIDAGTLGMKEKVYYKIRNAKDRFLGGWVTRKGIRCNCCRRVVSLTEFEAHAGSSLHQPWSNTCLVSGKPLIQSQLEAWAREKEKRKVGFRLVGVVDVDKNDDTCGICADGGDLICCDNCPSTFHLDCLQLKDLPEGNWYCPYCRCAFCMMAERKQDGANKASIFLTCLQCDRKYHRECAHENAVREQLHSNSVLFCGLNCNKVAAGLSHILGVRNPIGGGFSWTLLKHLEENEFNISDQMLAFIIECSSKLSVALSIMDECFVPLVDPRTGVDMISQAIYNCGSNFSRLNYQGFYTVVLEKGDEIISVASLRIHGTRLAEMPLIGTRPVYRRQGMCRRLLNGIEEMLSSLCVELLIIPAIPDMLETWMISFSFKPMELSQKNKIGNLSMMVFAETTLLQKSLCNKETKETGDDRHENVISSLSEGSQISHELLNLSNGEKAPRWSTDYSACVHKDATLVSHADINESKTMNGYASELSHVQNLSFRDLGMVIGGSYVGLEGISTPNSHVPEWLQNENGQRMDFSE